jgi:hypothetical protein
MAARMDVEDVQGIILRSYDHLPELRFVLLSAAKADPAGMRQWLKTLLAEVTPASRVGESDALNVAFAYPGLVALGLPATTLDGFAREFQHDPRPDDHRNRILGDEETSHPTNWMWGGPQVHVALMLYAKDASALEDCYRRHEVRFWAAGLEVVARVDASTLPGNKEHFGFRHGSRSPASRTTTLRTSGWVPWRSAPPRTPSRPASSSTAISIR